MKTFIYKSLDDLLNVFSKPDWLISYIYWEINLINNLGFGFVLDQNDLKSNTDKKIYNIELDNITYKIVFFPDNELHDKLTELARLSHDDFVTIRQYYDSEKSKNERQNYTCYF